MNSNRYTNLDYLRERTKGNTAMLLEMLRIYMAETPELIDTMKKSIATNNWESLRTASHTLVPSFSMVGLNSEYEEIAREIHHFARKKENMPAVEELFSKIDTACNMAFKEISEHIHSLEKAS